MDKPSTVNRVRIVGKNRQLASSAQSAPQVVNRMRVRYHLNIPIGLHYDCHSKKINKIDVNEPNCNRTRKRIEPNSIHSISITNHKSTRSHDSHRCRVDTLVVMSDARRISVSNRSKQTSHFFVCLGSLRESKNSFSGKLIKTKRSSPKLCVARTASDCSNEIENENNIKID